MSIEHSPARARKRIRRRGLAGHYDVNIRTVDSWAKRGVIPAPHYLEGSRIPFWFEDELDRSLTRQSEKSN